MINRLLKHSAILLTILTAFFYLVGISYNQGFLAEFGVPAKVFPVSLNQAILNGFIAILGVIGNYLQYIFYAIVGIFVINLSITLINEYYVDSEPDDQENSEKNNDPISATHNNAKNSFLQGTFNFLKVIGNALYGFLLFSIVLIAFLAGAVHISQNQGIERAKNLKENFHKQLIDSNNKDFKLIEFSWNDVKTKGAIMRYSDNYVLIYTEDFETLIFNNSKFGYIKISE